MSRDEWIRRQRLQKEYEWVDLQLYKWRNANGPVYLDLCKKRRNGLRSQMFRLREVQE